MHKKLDYHQVGLLPVLIVRDPATGHAEQAWCARASQNTLMRDDRFILDIDMQGGNEVSTMSAKDFHDFCTLNKIAIPHPTFFSTPAAQQYLVMIGDETTPVTQMHFQKAAGQDFRSPTPRTTRNTATLQTLLSNLMDRAPK